MKTFIPFIIVLFLSVGVTAQEESTINTTDDNTIAQNDSTTDQVSTTNQNTAEQENICYSETSKIAFYEALLKQNNMDINLEVKDTKSHDIALRNTEDIIKSNKNRISYSE